MEGQIKKFLAAVTLISLTVMYGCGGGGGGGTTAPSSYSIGGSVSGLTSSGLVLQNNASDDLSISANGTFRFPTSVTSGGTYSVTIKTQPSAPTQTCAVAGGSGTVASSAISTVVVSCTVAWAWVGGSDSPGAIIGVYGTKGVAANTNMPGARSDAIYWSDSAGNLWLFGGTGFDVNGNYGYLNDLWMFTPSTGQWTWVGGSNTMAADGVYGMKGVAASTNVPGARISAAHWQDSANNLWLFGGAGAASPGSAGNLNDLWKFNTNTKQWTWMAGSDVAGAVSVYGMQGVGAATNVPGARISPVSWTDSDGNFWLFGGAGPDGQGPFAYVSDMWMFSPTTGQWTWVSGATSIGASGVYGTKGVASATNAPGARIAPAYWADKSGNLWMLGGNGFDAVGVDFLLNDLWKFNTRTQQWTWISGSDRTAAVAVIGTQGVPADDNVPGARYVAASWIDTAGHLWMFGGYGNFTLQEQILLGDLWMFDPTSKQWTFVSNSASYAGVYGTKWIAAAGNTPGARQSAATWVDNNGERWFFGGAGYDSTIHWSVFNDLWKF